MLTALVTGAGGPAGRNMVRLLAASGCRVIGVDMQQMPWLGTPGSIFRLVVAANHPDYLQQLQELILEYQVVTVIPTVSDELLLLATHADQLAAFVASADPRLVLLGFLESSYQAGATRAGWDVATLRNEYAD